MISARPARARLPAGGYLESRRGWRILAAAL